VIHSPRVRIIARLVQSKRITLIGVPERGYHGLPAETSITRFTTVTRRAERPSALPVAAIW